MKKRKLRKGRILICLIAAVMIIMLSGGMFEAKADNSASDLMPVYVHDGDTLWGLVEANYDYSGDIRAAVHEVKVINHMTSSELIEGEIIYIPID